MRTILIILACISALASSAQKVDISYFDALAPRAIGPGGMSGRITCIDVIESNPNNLFVGSSAGGVWESKNGGISFKPIFDNAPIQSVGAIAINQKNPSEIWVGTGEGNPRNSQSSGGGVFKSIDGGRSWKLVGLEKTKTVHRIVIDRFSPNTVYVASLGSAWGPNKERGLFKTVDGGKTWTKSLYIDEKTGCSDLIVDPKNPNKLFAAMWQYGRKPYFFESGGDSSGVFMTYDGGANWKKLNEKNGLPKGKIGRVGLAISHSNPDIVYALIESKKTGLYRSDDGGHKWKLVTTKNIGNRPFYYADIYVDPVNPNKLWNLYSLVTTSEDGGKTFNVVMPYSGYHPDHHAFYIHPSNSDFIINGNDGGLNISRDGGQTWKFSENLPLGQFYHINYDLKTPYNIYGGMQDNGSWKGPSYIWKNGGIRNDYWQPLVFGDGFDVVPIPENDFEGYAMYQGGSLYRYHTGNESNKYIQPYSNDSVPLRWNWNAGIALDPFENEGVYFGSQFLHYSKDKGESWKIRSPDLTTNDKEKQKQATSGGLTIDATKAENYTSITTIGPSSFDKNVIWVGTDDGNIQLTKDGGTNWLNVGLNIQGLPTNSWVTQVVPSKHDSAAAFVVVNNYRQNDWKPYVYYTSNFGLSWKSLATADLPIYCLSIVQDHKEPNLLFLGTEYGLYFSIDKGNNWTKWDVDYPSVSTMDLKIHPIESDLIVGTFGRSAFVIDNISPFRALTKSGKIEKSIEIFESPTAYRASFKSPNGTLFPADGIFKGENRRSGAMITFWADPELISLKADTSWSEEEKKIKTEKKATIVFFNNNGDTIRNYKMKVDTGMNKTQWNLRENGIRGFGYKEIKKDADPTSGLSVEPGTYAFTISYRGQSDTGLLEVKMPRTLMQFLGVRSRK